MIGAPGSGVGNWRKNKVHYLYVNVKSPAPLSTPPKIPMSRKTTTYTISQLARHFAVTPRTVRFYEDKGLLSPRRVENQRIYREQDFVRLKLILRGRRIGFSLAALKHTLALYDTKSGEAAQIEYVLRTIGKHRTELEQRQKDIAATLEDMRGIEARIRENRPRASGRRCIENRMSVKGTE